MGFTKGHKSVKRRRWMVEDYIKFYFQSDEYNSDSYEDSINEIIGVIEKALFQNGINLPLGIYISRLRFSFEREFTVNPDVF